MKEYDGKVLGVVGGILITFLFLALAGASIAISVMLEPAFMPVVAAIFFVCAMVCIKGFFTLQPNEAMVFTLFGKYAGTYKKAGLSWCNPFYKSKKLSLRKRNFNVEKIKVNDALGNPIEISAIVVWKVEDTYQVTFDVDNYERYVETQSESALRHLAGMYPYDLFDDSDENNVVTLRDNSEEIAENLKISVQARLDKVGVEVVEARINHIAYAQEIAASMLQRQQATAIIAARKKIVEGAVSMVDMALKELNKKKIVTLSEKSKAEIVGNLLVVLCGDKSAQPIISTNGNE